MGGKGSGRAEGNPGNTNSGAKTGFSGRWPKGLKEGSRKAVRKQQTMNNGFAEVILGRYLKKVMADSEGDENYLLNNDKALEIALKLGLKSRQHYSQLEVAEKTRTTDANVFLEFIGNAVKEIKEVDKTQRKTLVRRAIKETIDAEFTEVTNQKRAARKSEKESSESDSVESVSETNREDCEVLPNSDNESASDSGSETQCNVVEDIDVN